MALWFTVLCRYFFFPQVEGLWQPFKEQVYRHCFFPTAFVSVSHFDYSHQFSYCGDLWSLIILLKLWLAQMVGMLLGIVQFTSVTQSLSNLLRPHEPQHARPPHPSPSTGLPKFMSIELVMPSNHLILCRPLLLLPSIFPKRGVFSNEPVLRIRWPKY